MISLCKCCFGSLKKADYFIKENADLRAEINTILAKEGLKYDGDIDVKHFLSVLFHEVGIETLKDKLVKTFSGLKIATHYGCHALRPSKIVQFDDPVAPSIFDQLVAVTGAKSIDWSTKLDCCGAPVLGINDNLSMTLTEKKMADGNNAGADYLCTACPFCQMQFDDVQKTILNGRESDRRLPSILYPQLLGLSMGIDRNLLGLEENRLSILEIEDFFKIPETTEV